MSIDVDMSLFTTIFDDHGSSLDVYTIGDVNQDSRDDILLLAYSNSVKYHAYVIYGNETYESYSLINQHDGYDIVLHTDVGASEDGSLCSRLLSTDDACWSRHHGHVVLALSHDPPYDTSCYVHQGVYIMPGISHPGHTNDDVGNPNSPIIWFIVGVGSVACAALIGLFVVKRRRAGRIGYDQVQ
jgi:hypothetical protein